MRVSGLPASHVIPALPERCPACGARGGKNPPAQFFRGIVWSPIRGQGTGAARVSQLLVDQVMREAAASLEQRKAIVFTDSRDDASNTAGGLELNHHRDLIRQAVHHELAAVAAPAEIMQRGAAVEPLSDADRRLLEVYKRAEPDVWAAYLLLARYPDDDQATGIVEAFERRQAREAGALPWSLLLERIKGRLLTVDSP